MKKNRLPKERTIYNNYVLWETYPYEDIKEMLIDNGYEEDEISDETICKMRYRQDEIDWEVAKHELTEFFKNNGNKWMIFGEVGRWDGTYKAGTLFDTFDDFFYDAAKDCDYIHFYDENGHLYLTCSHHDGTCHYEIKEVTDKGVQYLENWEYSEPKKEYLPIQKRFDNIYEKAKSNIYHKIRLEALQDMINELDMIPKQRKEVLKCLEEWENIYRISGYILKGRSKKYVHTQIFNRYSRLPRYAEKVYGCKRFEYQPITKSALIDKINNQAKSFYC